MQRLCPPRVEARSEDTRKSHGLASTQGARGLASPWHRKQRLFPGPRTLVGGTARRGYQRVLIPTKPATVITGSGCAQYSGRRSATGTPTMTCRGSTTASPALPSQGSRKCAGLVRFLLSDPVDRAPTWFHACPLVHLYLALHKAPRVHFWQKVAPTPTCTEKPSRAAPRRS